MDDFDSLCLGSLPAQPNKANPEYKVVLIFPIKQHLRCIIFTIFSVKNFEAAISSYWG